MLGRKSRHLLAKTLTELNLVNGVMTTIIFPLTRVVQVIVSDHYGVFDQRFI